MHPGRHDPSRTLTPPTPYSRRPPAPGPFPFPPFPPAILPPFPSMPPFPPSMPPPYWDHQSNPRSPYARSHTSERDYHDRDRYHPYPPPHSPPPYWSDRHHTHSHSFDHRSYSPPTQTYPQDYPHYLSTPPPRHSSPPPRPLPPPERPLPPRSNRSSARSAYDYSGSRVYGDSPQSTVQISPSQEDVIQGNDGRFGNPLPRRPKEPIPFVDTKKKVKSSPKQPLKKPSKRLVKTIPKPPPKPPLKVQKPKEPEHLPNGQPLEVSDIVADIVKNMHIGNIPTNAPSTPVQTAPPTSLVAPKPDGQPSTTAPQKTAPVPSISPSPPVTPQSTVPSVTKPTTAQRERQSHRLQIVNPDVSTSIVKKSPAPVVLEQLDVSRRNDADTIEVTIGTSTSSTKTQFPSADPPVDIVWKKASKRLEIVDPNEQPKPSSHVSPTIATNKPKTVPKPPAGTLSAISADTLFPASSHPGSPTDSANPLCNSPPAPRSITTIHQGVETSPELRQKPRPSMKYANGGTSTDALDTSEVIDLSGAGANTEEDGTGAPGLCNEVLDAVVKIYATHCDPNYSLPWQMRRQTQSTSSGFVISGRRILTNAHSVEHHTVVRVKKRASDEKYIARVLATGNECDLALLTVIDEEFWQDLNPLQFGLLPELQASVIVVGYPIGGENISVTAGVVSRVEIQDYTHGASQLLGIQIDAAINSGSSGGPALNHRNEVVGIAFQSLNTGDSENIGYLVAESVVDHFLKDYERNKRYTGFCHCGFLWQRMENISLRRSMRLKDDENGILVRRVNKQSKALKVLREGDIVSHIDGISISNAGTVPYRSGERISFHYIITTKFTGDPVRLNIIRNGKKMEIEYALGESSENLLVPVHEQRRQPEYLVVAGLVFVALSEPYLADEYGDKWDLKAPVRLLERLMYGSKETADEQVVVLSQVLNAEINIGYEYVINTRVHKFNGAKLRNLAQLAKLVETCQDDYLRFDLDDEIVVVGRQEAIESSKEIMKTHCIPSAYSIGDLPMHGLENGVIEEVKSFEDEEGEVVEMETSSDWNSGRQLPNGHQERVSD